MADNIETHFSNAVFNTVLLIASNQPMVLRAMECSASKQALVEMVKGLAGESARKMAERIAKDNYADADVENATESIERDLDYFQEEIALRSLDIYEFYHTHRTHPHLVVRERKAKEQHLHQLTVQFALLAAKSDEDLPSGFSAICARVYLDTAVEDRFIVLKV